MPRYLSVVVTLLFVVFSPLSQAELVKKSRSAICHDSSSPFFTRVKNFTPYESLEECLQFGGRLPKKAKESATRSHNENTGYSRDKFGHGWDDEDGDCINTRHELLMAQTSGQMRSGRNLPTILSTCLQYRPVKIGRKARRVHWNGCRQMNRFTASTSLTSSVF